MRILQAAPAVLIAVLLVGMAASAAVAEDGKQKPANVAPPKTATASSTSDTTDTTVKDTTAIHKVVVYYFHGNKRCVSCRKIEQYTQTAIDSGFAAELKSGALEWRVVNTDSSQNEHYLTDYQMYTKSVILSDLHGGKETRWKNLEKVWELLGDENDFAAYVRSELTPYLDPTK